MLASVNVLLTSGLILTLLISAAVVTYTGKFYFVYDTLKKSNNQIYDPDHKFNCTIICIFSENMYSTKYERSPCFNKTLLHWYNPWLHSNLWRKFRSKIQARNQLKLMKKLEEKTENATADGMLNKAAAPGHLEEKKETGIQKVTEKPVEFAYSVLIGLLILSGVATCWEVFKDKLKRNETAAAKAQERQCSLADFTIKRHLRRESQQQTNSHLSRQASLELTAKVTQNLIHQSSLDRAYPKKTSEALTALMSRRNSVPVYFADVQQKSVMAKVSKRQSVDISTEDMTLDSKRKSRHFIRRH